MRAMVKTGPEPGAEPRTVDVPVPGRGDVLLRVDAASVCGTDRELVEWSPSAAAFGLRFPVVMGHEAAGTVVEVGADVTGVRVLLGAGAAKVLLLPDGARPGVSAATAPRAG